MAVCLWLSCLVGKDEFFLVMRQQNSITSCGRCVVKCLRVGIITVCWLLCVWEFSLLAFWLRFIYLYLLNMFIDFREGGEREEHRLVTSCVHPNQGLNLWPMYVLWWGIESPAFWDTGGYSNQLSHTGKGAWLHFKWGFYLLIFTHTPLDIDISLKSLLIKKSQVFLDSVIFCPLMPGRTFLFWKCTIWTAYKL